MVKTAVILAAGLGSRIKERTIEKPKGFLEIDGLPIVERSIMRLIDSGIEQIWIGTGYLSEIYEQLTQKYKQVTCVFNEHYSQTGSMRTLYTLREVIKEDFLLLESDLLYDPACLLNLIADTRQDVILASGTTHSGDEVYIESDDGFLIAMSKEAGELSQVHSELVGISKLSLNTYQMMCRVAEGSFEGSPKLDYEQALVEVAREKPLTVNKIEKLVWCEIDTEEHLQRAQQLIYPMISNTGPSIDLPVKRNILLNPGPATTTDTVKLAQVVPDICPRELEFGDLMGWISKQLTLFVGSEKRYDTVLFGGSGTAGVESVISSVVGEGKLLILSNGSYGERMAEIAEVYRVDHEVFTSSPILPLPLDEIEQVLSQNDGKITHVAVVHNETTSGILNDIEAVGKLCAKHNADFIVDAMSSYGAIPIHMETAGISYLISSSNKNLQGMAGIAFVVADKQKLAALSSHSPKSYYLDLFKQHDNFKRTHQLRFTPPVQTLYALKQAIIETQIEGIEQRYHRYSESWEILIAGLERLGLECLVPLQYHSKIITAIKEPLTANYNFEEMHDYLYERGITIYPGKIGRMQSFRIANIGAISKCDIEYMLKILEEYLL